MTLRRASSTTLLTASLVLLGPGCFSIPPDLQTDMEPPDGSRPNNFGVLVGESEIRPDRPTIASATTSATTTAEGAPR